MREAASRGLPRWRRWAGRIGLAVALAAGLAYLPYRLRDSGPSAPLLEAELARTRAEIARLRADNARDAREIEALRTDPAASEDLARDDLGLVREGELIIRLEAAAGDARSASGPADVGGL